MGSKGQPTYVDPPRQDSDRDARVGAGGVRDPAGAELLVRVCLWVGWRWVDRKSARPAEPTPVEGPGESRTASQTSENLERCAQGHIMPDRGRGCLSDMVLIRKWDRL